MSAEGDLRRVLENLRGERDRIQREMETHSYMEPAALSMIEWTSEKRAVQRSIDIVLITLALPLDDTHDELNLDDDYLRGAS
jgi:hypothetical protein